MERYLYKIVRLTEISRDFYFASRYSFQDLLLWNSVARRGVLKPIVITAFRPRHWEEASEIPRPSQRGLQQTPSLRGGPKARRSNLTGSGQAPQSREIASLSRQGGIARNDMVIVSGHKRLLAAGAAGLQEIPAFEILEAPNSADLYLLALFSNWNQAMSDLDRAWAVKRAVLDFHFDEKTVLEDLLPALGLAPQRHFLEESLEVAGLEAVVLQAIGAGKIPFRGARMLGRFSKSDQRDFTLFIAERAALTTNQLLRTGEWLYDLIKIKGGTLKNLLNSCGLEAILAAPSRDRRQMAEKFYTALRALRFPDLVQKEKEFESIAGRIEEDRSFSLEPPAFFEGEGLTLRARLASPAALDKLAAVLERKRKLFNSLFDIML